MHDRGLDEESEELGCVRLLLERFPYVQLVSLQLLLKDQAFRDLCEEYEVCTAACERHAQSGADEAMHWEYNAFRLRLEAELLGYIAAWK